MKEVEEEPIAEAEPELAKEVEPAVETIEPEEEPDLGRETAEGEIEITVEGMAAAFQGDKVAANERFTDRVLRVSGSVDKVIVKDMLDIYYILLKGTAKKTLWNVRCTFGKQDAPQFRRLAAEQVVTVQGKYGGYERNILLKDCVLLG